MRQSLTETELLDIREYFQGISNKYGAVITLAWRDKMHECFTPKKEDDSQLTFKELEIGVRQICQKTEVGE